MDWRLCKKMCKTQCNFGDKESGKHQKVIIIDN
jgi:hypothetical protein